MKIDKTKIKNALGASVNTLFTFGGIALVGYGAYQIYIPSAFIVVGAVMFYIGLPDR